MNQEVDKEQDLTLFKFQQTVIFNLVEKIKKLYVSKYKKDKQDK